MRSHRTLRAHIYQAIGQLDTLLTIIYSCYYGIILCYNNHNVLILFLHVNLITPDGYTDSKLLS